MPTFERLPRFDKDWSNISPAEQARFRGAVEGFVSDLAACRSVRKGLRVKRVEGTSEVWEMTYAPDGRATWHVGHEVRPGEAHVVWRRIGTHSIFSRP